MRRSTPPRSLTSALAILVLSALPGGALAQYDAPSSLGDETKADEGVPAPMDEPGAGGEGDSLALPGPAPDFARAPRTYTVQPGDTLWDITSTFLGNPWYWPKVWSMNKQIENPNWIEPGTVISFVGGGEALPAEVEPEEEAAPVALGEVPDDNEVSIVGKRYQAPTSVRLLDEGFVTHAELEAAGKVVSSFEEKTLLTTYDRAYVEFPKPVSVGSRYVAFRTDREIRNPKTGKVVGYLTRILGVGRIVSAPQGKLPTLVIEGVLDTISRGDRLMPWSESLGRTILERPNQVELEGMVLATFVPRQVLIGESHFVFIDKGRRDGVEIGNTFTIYQRGDPLDIDHRIENPDQLPWEAVGRVMVVEARDEVSTAVVVRSFREIETGDRAVMQVSGGQAMR